MKPTTSAIHAGVHESDPHFGSVVPPIYPSSTFIFPNAQEGARRFAGESAGMIYSRLTNPTVSALETRIAAVEGAEMCITTASGMAAVTLPLFHFLKSGDRILAHKCLYGSSFDLVNRILPRYGIACDLIDFKDTKAVKDALKKNTKVLYFETPTNPMMEIIDMEAIAEIARNAGVISIVDATFGPAIMQEPFKAGIDVVVHSLTKYMGGHSDLIAGAVLGSTQLLKPMFKDLFPVFGPTISPFTAYLVMRGIATMGVRIKQINENAQIVAEYLESHPKIARVYYPGLDSHPQRALAKKQMPGGYGAVMSFEMKGGYTAAEKLVNTVSLFSLAVSLGGVESLIEHPASMTHSKLTEKEQLEAGVLPGLVRISVGIESSEDQIKALDTALNSL
ncbi:MAG: aminotransferase class I/II-fold pyridoxal phosphate-dependent enzyme [Patescibacteria group bacterium]|nr:aminotransferase class I/II-fold pyridoxal phosphate-dependent enzyme [Patescibacteria group bacterium]